MNAKHTACRREEALWNLIPVKHSLNQSNILTELLNNQNSGQRSVAVNVLGGGRKRLMWGKFSESFIK